MPEGAVRGSDLGGNTASPPGLWAVRDARSVRSNGERPGALHARRCFLGAWASCLRGGWSGGGIAPACVADWLVVLRRGTPRHSGGYRRSRCRSWACRRARVAGRWFGGLAVGLIVVSQPCLAGAGQPTVSDRSAIV